MIGKYYEFNVKKFYSHYHPNKVRLKSLQYELASIPILGGMDYSKPSVQTSGTSDPVFAKVSEREKTTEKISQLELYFRLCDIIDSQLTTAEKIFVEVFMGDITIEDAAMRIGCGMTMAYRRMNATEKKIQEIVDFESCK